MGYVDGWRLMYQALLAERGHVEWPNLPKNYVTGGGVHLGFWLSTQRRLAFRGKLMKFRHRELIKIGLRLHPLRAPLLGPQDSMRRFVTFYTEFEKASGRYLIGAVN